MSTAVAGSAQVRCIGVLGGMSWESTASYYRLINEGIRDRLGGLHSARLVMVSVDFAEIERLQSAGEWETAGEVLGQAAHQLATAGADFLLIATNTMHKVAHLIERASGLPLLHIADASAAAAQAAGVKAVGLLGTRFTMEHDFYRGRLERHGLRVLVPEPARRLEIDRVIYEELCRGQILESSRAAYGEVLQSFAEGGAQAVILGCTEIALLIRDEDSALPLLDTTAQHCNAAITVALGGDMPATPA